MRAIAAPCRGTARPRARASLVRRAQVDVPRARRPPRLPPAGEGPPPANAAQQSTRHGSTARRSPADTSHQPRPPPHRESDGHSIVYQGGADKHRRSYHPDVTCRNGRSAVGECLCKKTWVRELRGWGGATYWKTTVAPASDAQGGASGGGGTNRRAPGASGLGHITDTGWRCRQRCGTLCVEGPNKDRQQESAADDAVCRTSRGGSPMATPPVMINRAPVLPLWAAVVAERLGYDRDAR
jgi:hypothetical protein